MEFSDYGLERAWEHVIGVVVQPGVDFGDNVIYPYKPEEASDLMSVLHDYPHLVFEGHSTDYQSAESLRLMVSDGIAILKVGPELTFGLREAIFALSGLEAKLVPEAMRTPIEAVLEHEMKQNPVYWQKYYVGSEEEKMLARRYSMSDRIRYYIGKSEVDAMISQLTQQVNDTRIPIGLVHQFFPEASFQHEDCVSLDLSTRLLEGRIMQTVNRYYDACGL